MVAFAVFVAVEEGGGEVVSGELESEREFVLVNCDFFASELKEGLVEFVDQEAAVSVVVEG